jgi:hypothetical protein
MNRRSRSLLVALSALALVVLAGITVSLTPRRGDSGLPVAPADKPKGIDDRPVDDGSRSDTSTFEVTDYTRPKDDDTLLVDDRIEDKKTAFDPNLVDRRPMEGWSLNASEAVIRLDVPIVKPDLNPERLVLYPSYSAAIAQANSVVFLLLPSVNMIDGKAKQFDDGLYAAIDQAYYLGHGETMKSHLETIRRIRQKVAKGSPADDYLLAGLSLASETVELSPRAKGLAKDFLSKEVLSKPIGFYTWNRPLSDCFRVLRYFAQPIEGDAIPLEIARVLRENESLRKDYVAAYSFYAKLTNPLVGLTPVDFLNGIPKLQDPPKPVSLFPAASSRETELFEKLFPNGLPPDANLMRELITAIRSGKVDLKPRLDGGWYEYQVYALETLLLPEKGDESNKLLLTKTYKKRMLEAFKALVTKRRETHSRELYGGKTEEAAPPPIKELKFVQPRLRVEPNPTYFLRTARSYAFLASFLEATLGEATLKSLHGLRETGPRQPDLHAELRSMRDLFYGLYLLSAEDIGAKPALLEGETVDREKCEKSAGDWLASIKTDPDLAADTRVSVPLFYDVRTNTVRLWMTIGVRLTALDARYARGPQVRPADGSADWKRVEPYKLLPIEYLIPVDEFAEVELKGGRVLTRAELRAICDRMKTKEKIIEALQR